MPCVNCVRKLSVCGPKCTKCAASVRPARPRSCANEWKAANVVVRHVAKPVRRADRVTANARQVGRAMGKARRALVRETVNVLRAVHATAKQVHLTARVMAKARRGLARAMKVVAARKQMKRTTPSRKPTRT